MQTLEKIVQRAPAVGAKIWCLSLCFYRQDAAKRQIVGITCTHRPKVRLFAPQRRLLAPIHIQFGTADEHLGPLDCAKFSSIGAGGRECSPKYQKIHFLVKSRFAGANPLSLFFFLSVTLRGRSIYRAFEGCIVRTSIALPFIGRFRRSFSVFRLNA